MIFFGKIQSAVDPEDREKTKRILALQPIILKEQRGF